MGNFNRGSRSGGGDFRRGGFGGNRESDRPVEMHQVVCGKCGKDCEVPFRPTNDRPVYCSNCFENNRNSDSRPTNFENREMFTTTCADCGSTCQVPFRPINGKPVFCSNCFGDKKEGRSNRREQSNSQPQNKNEFVKLNAKLDRILAMLSPKTIVEELVVEPVETEKKAKVAKKKPSKK